MRPLPPLAVFALFAVGLEAIVGLSLGLSNGLSETHKSVLVAFIAGFPALTLFVFVQMMTRGEPAEAAPFRPRKMALSPEPLAAGAKGG